MLSRSLRRVSSAPIGVEPPARPVGNPEVRSGSPAVGLLPGSSAAGIPAAARAASPVVILPGGRGAVPPGRGRIGAGRKAAWSLVWICAGTAAAASGAAFGLEVRPFTVTVGRPGRGSELTAGRSAGCSGRSVFDAVPVASRSSSIASRGRHWPATAAAAVVRAGKAAARSGSGAAVTARSVAASGAAVVGNEAAAGWGFAARRSSGRLVAGCCSCCSGVRAANSTSRRG